MKKYFLRYQHITGDFIVLEFDNLFDFCKTLDKKADGTHIDASSISFWTSDAKPYDHEKEDQAHAH